jgi:ribosomal protein S16
LSSGCAATAAAKNLFSASWSPIGTYDPSFDPPKVELRKDQAHRWLGSGAVPSPTVRKLIAQVSSTA